ncbi:conserved hypothetical protein [Talaromyces stipitatus ATCC 10500]|uniref:INO80 complex subunit F domain-containing protein n=1 Tax=Talaromyces stipitatus (strain ATCC 10500 / CBS 375.48 / QM 6759 / NRRL 1006) TaxID=441959 RepID=B8MLI5_TALSN|nr:uncharacterized protein TSTA_049550 [Talaromyces stipitatus ATCC 10500]EED15518.1 conserved hypothetical protein [Talaromyces stipitatus ATCC 10500]
MDTSAPSTSATNNTANPPSIELAYKKKCIQLKKRLNEIEAENDLIRARNKRAKYYVAKMRLETCIMLERLATVTGMLDEAGAAAAAGNAAGGQHPGAGAGLISAELRAKAAAIVTSAHAQNKQSMMDDETEGSSEEQPPTPQERPLRVKRSRKSNIAFEEIEAEAAMQYEASSPEHRANDSSYNNNNLDVDSGRNIGTGDEHHDDDINDRTPSQGVDRERSALATGGPGGEDRQFSGFRAVNSRVDSQGGVPMDVDEKPRSES